MNKKITILVDNDSWILSYAKILADKFFDKGFDVCLVRNHSEVEEGWVNFMLGCIKLTPKKILEKNQHNFVIHESKLPFGKGFSPMTWGILGNQNIIPICLIEASDKVDSGDIWIEDAIHLDGTELNNEWKSKQGNKTIEMCLRAIDEYKNIKPRRQIGDSTFFRRRKKEDSELDLDKSLGQQFPLLRAVDNELYPAFFYRNGIKYILRIQKA